MSAFGSVLTQADSEPLAIRDLDPLLAGYELPPALPSSADKIGATQLNVQYDVSNTSLNQSAGNQAANEHAAEHVIVDGEIHRWQLTLSHALNEHFTVRAEVPYQSVSGGSLDTFIENFHHDFGFPNGNRASWPRDRLLVSYSENGQTLYQQTETSTSLGDITLRAGWHFNDEARHTTSLWFSVKLPTGNAQRLTGSGSVDTAVSLSTMQALGARIASYEQLSLSVLGSGERMENKQREFAWSGTAGIDWSLSTRFSILAQLDGHTRVFDSNTRLLGNSLQFSFGPRYGSGRWQTTLTMSEDLAVDTAPDVQFQLNVGYRYK